MTDSRKPARSEKAKAARTTPSRAKARIVRLGKVRDLTLGSGMQYVDGRKNSERQ